MNTVLKHLLNSEMNKKGQILITVFLIVLIIGVLGLSFLSLSRMETIQFRKQIYYLQAFNIAEAGIERAIWKLKNSPGWTDGWQGQQLGNGTYSVSIELQEDDYYKITSTATVVNINKTIELVVEVKNKVWPDAFGYALFWGNSAGYNGDLTIKNNAFIDGDIFGYGDLNIKNNATVSGYVYSTGEVSGNGNYQVGELPEPLPERPEFDTTYYDNLLSQAQSKPQGNWSLKNNRTYNLNGDTLFVNGNVIISNNCIVYGPGKIVATGKITVSNNVEMSNNIDLIAGGQIYLGNNSKIEGEGNIIFSNTSIVIKNNNAAGMKTLIYSEGSVSLKNNAKVRGIIWGNEVELKNNATVVGLIYGDSFYKNEIPNNFILTYDPAVLDMTPPPGVPEGEGVEVNKIQWNEEEAEGI